MAPRRSALLGLALAAFGCWASHPGWVDPEAGAEADADVPTDVDAEAEAADTVPEADGTESCIPAESVETGDLFAAPDRYEGREVWLHGLGIARTDWPNAFDCPSYDICRNDACCNDCTADFGVGGEYFVSGLHVAWPAGVEPACSGNDCRMTCTPWTSGTEMYVHGLLTGLVDEWLLPTLHADREPCVVGLGLPTGTWHVRVRSLDYSLCRSPVIAWGLEGQFYFWFDEGTPTAALWLHPISETAAPLRGTFDGTTLDVHSTRDCGHCPCVFDLHATFAGHSSLVASAFIEQDCDCVAAFSFEGFRISEAVSFPPEE
ncbi:MAG: hypothetical protein HY905_24210 [Deltaproteobacteria bacterium]|nr:hypothetical protein [Deltaproteobacteria bacterium]